MITEKSSFFKREISKPDAIKQFFRPYLSSRATQALDVFERFVSECEMVTTLGTSFQAGQEKLLITPEEVKENMDEFSELQQIAIKGRALLREINYVSPRKASPMVGQAPVGKNVDVVPITVQHPGQEGLAGVVVQPKEKK